ncbi:MAG: Undecaprenyl-phosphate galactose phosphotransferase, WbaP, partial [Firmicutes bacterium]|nr:Undecaprenyl-phosphate galactose phosphotransferase, WbaP [Bacillota bacterium]
LVKSSLWQKPVVIVGAGKTAELLANRFSTEEGWGYVIRGLVEDNLEKSSLVKKYPCLGGFTQVEQIVIDSKVKEVIVAAPGLNREKLIDLVWRIQPYVSNVTIIPDLFGVPLSNMEVETLINERVVMLRVKNNLAFFHNKIIKKAFDLVAVITVFPVILIIILILMAIVKLDSKGTALYIGTRLGQKGKLFSCYKLRTMYENSDMRMADYFNSHPLAWKEWRKYSKLKEYDPRVTKVGKWLRKASLDELPQIFNVLRGEMSLVGPRPYLLCELEQMGFQARTILETVPGITGLWQVSGRNEIDFKGRLQMDSWYVRNWSVWQDIILLFKTMGVWLGRKGAY